MRFFTRLHACVAATFVVCLYFAWRQPSLRIQDNISTAWKGTAHRVVVFGDDWSDIGEYRVSPPPKKTVQDRDPFRGPLWVETLCEELSCDFIDNFARSIPSNVEMKTVGSVVNSDVFSNATSGRKDETLVLFDFQTQVQHFLAFENKKMKIPGNLRKVDDWTIFTVYFGTWDLMEYSMLDKDAALHAVDESIAELMHNLDILADHVGDGIKIIIPRLMDVSFLPRYSNKKKDATDKFAMAHHEVVFLWTYWNMMLAKATENWVKGDIFVPDAHGLIVEQVRAQQLYSKQISDATGFGEQAPLFIEVEEPCLGTADESASDLPLADVKRCLEPASHLFWDDITLSGPAHELIGKEAAGLVRTNRIVNAQARQQAQQSQDAGSVSGQKKQGKDGKGFNLKFPPGY